MDNKRKVKILQQEIEVIKQQNKLAKVCLSVVKAWGDKQINKRLATAIQDKVDKVYGVEPLTADQQNWRPEKKHWSNVNVYYTKDDTWNGEPKYGLTASSDKLVKRLPDIKHDNYNSPDEHNSHQVEVGAIYAQNIEEIKDGFNRYGLERADNYQDMIVIKR